MSMRAALSLIPEKIDRLLRDYEKELDDAWLKTEGSLKITFGVKFDIQEGMNTCEVAISFTPLKVSDKINFTWSDQPTLFGTSWEKKVESDNGKTPG